MTALREIKHVRQIPGEPRRRWFSSRTMDLFVWLDEAGMPAGFQLAYDKGGRERALTWKPEQGFRHTGVDDGESDRRLCKATPLLVADGEPDVRGILDDLQRQGDALPPDILEFVLATLRAYPG